MRRASCQSNMKQLGLAMEQYSQDNDSALPAAMLPSGQDWRKAIYPFVKSTYVYRCPSDRRMSHDTPENLPKSYGASPAVLRGDKAGSNPLSIAVVDMRGYGGAEWNIASPAFQPHTGRRLYAHFPSHAFYERPPGRLNVLFGDGHVKAIEPMATLVPLNLWTQDNKPFTGRDLENARAVLARAARD